jgi:uncharacterized protein (TIGR02646 family)
MRAIDKGREPTSLAEYRAGQHATYEDMPSAVKDSLRDALLGEQGCLCAYCMSRITRNNMRVEHWHSQSGYSGQQLEYRNLLGCCTGKSSNDPHCDVSKEGSDISLNPSDRDHHPRLQISYRLDGTVLSREAQFNTELNDILKLNVPRLKSNRRKVIDALWYVLKKDNAVRKCRKKLLISWQSKDDRGMLQEYCGVAEYFLSRDQGVA